MQFTMKLKIESRHSVKYCTRSWWLYHRPSRNRRSSSGLNWPCSTFILYVTYIIPDLIYIWSYVYGFFWKSTFGQRCDVVGEIVEILWCCLFCTYSDIWFTWKWRETQRGNVFSTCRSGLWRWCSNVNRNRSIKVHLILDLNLHSYVNLLNFWQTGF